MLLATVLAGLALAATGCTTPAGPVEAVRFHAPARVGELGRGVIVVLPGPDMDAASLEYRTYAAAVARELAAAGYAVADAASPAPDDAQRALVSFERTSLSPPVAGRNPVSVGVGGQTGSYGSGLGVGVGINLGGRPRERIVTELRSSIRAADGATLWEGRSSVEATAGSPLAQSSLNAAKLAKGLFLDFPGESGATIRLK